MIEAPKPRGYLPIDGIAAYDSAVQGPRLRRRQRRRQGRPRRHRAGARRHRRPEGRRRLPASSVNPARQGADQRPELGEPPRAVRPAPASRSRPTRTTTRPRRGVDFDGMLAALNAAAGRHRSSCCTPAATTRPATTSRPAVGRRWSPPSRRAAWCPSSTWPTRASATASPKTARWSRMFVAAGLDFFVSTSFSKSFSLYGERVGALSVVCASKDEAARVLSQLKIVIRTNYSNPPTHGAQVVATVLTTPALRAHVGRRAGRHARAHQGRCARALVEQAEGRRREAGHRASSPASSGMFSYSGLTQDADAAPAQRVRRLRRRFRPHLRGRAEQQEHRRTSSRRSPR